MRLRSDEQLVALFRAGHDEAFRVIHDRYRQRLFAYARQMLPGRQDAEDALQDVFVRAYSSLRSSDRQLALRAWLYRIAHNRCIDELRRPLPPPPEAMQFICSPIQDPIAQADQRESLRRLVADVRRLPRQQRSALLMRELGGMSYAELAGVLGVSVPAVKSLLVRARMALALAMEARDTACDQIREELVLAHDRRVRPGANARRHMRDCPGCCEFRRQLRGVSRQLAGLSPAIGPLGVLAKVLGVGGGAGGGAAATGGLSAFAGAGSGGVFASIGGLTTGAGHVATLIAATVVTAGGAVEIQRTITPAVHHQARPALRTLPAAAPSQAPALPPRSSGTIATGPVVAAEAVIVAAVVQAPSAAAVAPPARVITPGAASGPASSAAIKQAKRESRQQLSATLAGTPSISEGWPPRAAAPPAGSGTSTAGGSTANGVSAGAEPAPAAAPGNPGSSSTAAPGATTSQSSATSAGTSPATGSGPSSAGTSSGTSTPAAAGAGSASGSSSSAATGSGGPATTSGR